MKYVNKWWKQNIYFFSIKVGVGFSSISCLFLVQMSYPGTFFESPWQGLSLDTKIEGISCLFGRDIHQNVAFQFIDSDWKWGIQIKSRFFRKSHFPPTKVLDFNGFWSPNTPIIRNNCPSEWVLSSPHFDQLGHREPLPLSVIPNWVLLQYTKYKSITVLAG